MSRENYADTGVVDYEDLPRRAGVFSLTDLGNSEYFTSTHAGRVIHDHRRARWLLHRGHRWAPDADGEIRRLAAAAMRERLREAADIDDESTRARAVKWAIGSETRSRIESLLWFAASDVRIADAGESFDANGWQLGASNGVVHLHTGTLQPGRAEDRITMSVSVPFDPDATCPRWEQFTREVCADPALEQFVQRAVGYSLTGDTSEQCLFLLYGVGANGKSTFTGTLDYVFGDYAYSMPFSTIELHQRAAIPNDLAALLGRRFITASETNDGTRLNEGRIKALTGCDPITARFLHSEFFTFRPVAKFWLAVNHKPIVRDDSHGFWRRIRLIPFTQTFTQNTTLADTLREEAPGILAWAVRGCLAWQRDGLDPPAIVTAATQEYARDSDPLGAFLGEACELDPGADVGAKDLFEHYRTWATHHGFTDRERLTATMFGRKMAERFEHEHTRTGKLYKGIARRLL